MNLDALKARETELANFIQQGMANLNQANGRLLEVKELIQTLVGVVEGVSPEAPAPVPAAPLEGEALPKQ